MPEIRVDGVALDVPPGVDLVTCLLGPELRSRGVVAPLCAMGTCFQCLVEIDGRPHRRACMVRVHEGMEVRTNG